MMPRTIALHEIQHGGQSTLSPCTFCADIANEMTPRSLNLGTLLTSGNVLWLVLFLKMFDLKKWHPCPGPGPNLVRAELPGSSGVLKWQSFSLGIMAGMAAAFGQEKLVQ